PTRRSSDLYPVESRDGSAHPFRSVFRKSLYVLPGFKGHIRQQKRRCLGPLTAAAMPSDFVSNAHHHLSLTFMYYYSSLSFIFFNKFYYTYRFHQCKVKV